MLNSNLKGTTTPARMVELNGLQYFFVLNADFISFSLFPFCHQLHKLFSFSVITPDENFI